MKTHAALALIVTGLATASLVLFQPAHGRSKPMPRGQYLATVMDCGGCHTPGALRGEPDASRPFAGSDVGFKLPGLGVFFPPNLTPDPETGLGRWSVEDIVTAVRTGRRPDGRILAPVMPYHNYSALTDEDARELASFFKALPALPNKVPGPFGDSQMPTAPFLALTGPKS